MNVSIDLKKIMRVVEKKVFDSAMKKTKNNKSRAARLVCLSRPTFCHRWNLLKKNKSEFVFDTDPFGQLDNFLNERPE